jgi:hypothetical protein
MFRLHRGDGMARLRPVLKRRIYRTGRRSRLQAGGLALALLAGSCQRGADEGAAILLEEKTAQINRLEAELRNRENQQAREMDFARGELRQKEIEFQRQRDETQQLLRMKDERIAVLERQLADSREAVRPPVVEPPVGIPVRPAEREVRPAAASRPAEIRASFPLRVFDVEGRKAVTGTHTTYRTVETGQTFRDEYGNRKPALSVQEDLQNQYGYQAVFSVENLTAEAQTMTVRAGLITRHFTVPPGAVLTNLSVNAARGGGLQVAVGGRTQTHPVRYRDE